MIHTIEFVSIRNAKKWLTRKNKIYSIVVERLLTFIVVFTGAEAGFIVKLLDVFQN